MNGPTRPLHSDGRRTARLSGRAVSSADVFDELEQFVDSEPVGWSERQQRRRGALPTEASHASVDTDWQEEREAAAPYRAAVAEDEPAAGDVAFSSAGSREGSSARRREAFAQRLSAELDRPARKSEPRASPPEPQPTAERPVAEAAPQGARPAPSPPPPTMRERLGPRLEAARSAAASQQGPARPEAVPRPPRHDPPPLSHNETASAASELPRPTRDPASTTRAPEIHLDDDGPADALDWELDNAISAIVASTHKKPEAPSAEFSAAGEAPDIPEEDEAPAQEALAPAEEPAARERPAPGETDPPAVVAASPVVGTKRPKPVPTFRFERRTESEELDPAPPPDFDNPLTSILFKDVRAKFDAVHPPADADLAEGEADYADEFADYGPDELEDEYAFEDEDEDHLPPSLRRSASRRRAGRLSGRAVGMLVVGVVGLAVLVAGGLIGFDMFSGGGISGREPPVIHADARDVKVRAPDIQVDAEPDIMERTALGDTEELVLPDRVEIGRRNTISFEGDPDPAAERRVRTVMVQPDGTIVPRETPASAASRTLTPVDVAALETDRTTSSDAVTSDLAPDVSAEPSLPQPPAIGTSGGGAVTSEPQGAPGTMDETVTASLDTTGDTADEAAPDDGEGAGVTPRRRPTPPPSRTASASPAPTVAGSGPAPVSAATTSAGNAPWGVQISSQRSRADAEQSFANFRARYGSIIGGMEPDIVAANVGDRGLFYRVRLPADSRGAAASLCQRLKSAGADCFIGRN